VFSHDSTALAASGSTPEDFLAIPLFERPELVCEAAFRDLQAEQGVARAARVTGVQSSISRHSTPLLLRVKQVRERPKTSSFLSVPLPRSKQAHLRDPCWDQVVLFSPFHSPIEKAGEFFLHGRKPVSAALKKSAEKKKKLLPVGRDGHGVINPAACLTLNLPR
jgi:hypothetical protein